MGWKSITITILVLLFFSREQWIQDTIGDTLMSLGISLIVILIPAAFFWALVLQTPSRDQEVSGWIAMQQLEEREDHHDR